MKRAARIEQLPPYLFAELDRKLAARRAEGVDVISLGVGDPDLPTPAHVVEALADAARDPSTHRYPSYYGLPAFREAIAGFYERRFGVGLNPQTEVLPLIGSKEGLAHLSFALVDRGDRALVPDPGYPVYAISTALAGGEAVPMPLTAEHGFLPDLAALQVPRSCGSGTPAIRRAPSPTSPSSRKPSRSRGDRICCSATTPRIRRSPSTATSRRACCRFRARRTSPWSSARSLRPTT